MISNPLDLPRPLALLGVLALLAPSEAAATDFEARIAEAPTAEDLPRADGVWVYRGTHYRFDEEGRLVREYDQALRMFTAWLTRHDWFDPHVNWNDARSELEMEAAWTSMRDGTRVEARDNSFVPNTAGALQWAVPYAHIRQMVVSHVGVEHGATSVLSYTLTDREPPAHPPWGWQPLQDQIPIAEQELIFELPEGTPLHLDGIGCSLAPASRKSEGRVIHTLHREDVPAANLAELSPGSHAGVQQLAWSTARDWEQVRTWLESRVHPAMEVTPPVEDRAEAVLEGATFAPEQIALLHDFVVNAVRTVDWPVAQLDYAARPAAEVLDSSVGHALDKAVLLGSLLEASGIEATVALSTAEPQWSSEVPTPDQLPEVWVRATLPTGQVTWLDPAAPAADHNRFHLAGQPVLLLDGAATGLEQVPEASPDSNQARFQADLELQANEDTLSLQGTLELDLVGLRNPHPAYDRTEDRTAALAGRLAGAFGGAQVDAARLGFQTCRATSLAVDFSGGSVEIPEHGFVAVSLPLPPGGSTPADLHLYRNERSLPLHLPGPTHERVSLTVQLPEGWTAADLPPAVSLEAPMGRFQREVTLEEAELVVEETWELTSDWVAPEDYPRLRALYLARFGDHGRSLLLRRTPDPATADASP